MTSKRCGVGVVEAMEDIQSLVTYAYEQGFHELGYDPVAVVANALLPDDETPEGYSQEYADQMRTALACIVAEPETMSWHGLKHIAREGLLQRCSPPDILADAPQDVVHKDIGLSSLGRSAKTNLPNIELKDISIPAMARTERRWCSEHGINWDEGCNTCAEARST